MLMKRIVLCTVFICIALLNPWLHAQVILGTDTSQHIVVTTSSNYTPQFWSHTASGDKTINKIGLEGSVMEASRFLSQATLGVDLQDIEYTAHIGIASWIDEQLAMPVNPIYPQLEQIYADVIQWYLL